ncbi:MAG TPA: hypothetical protein VMY77_04750, partial [Chitinophagaceae bacterium]|nr:hypothetical protein [Chitinophagaceae bacterium]
PTRVYDETINTLQTAVERSKLGNTDKQQAIKALTKIAQQAEKDFTPQDNVEQLIEKERNESWMHGGRTIFGDAKPPNNKQLKLF